MAINDFIPLLPHEDDDEDQPELIPPNDPPQPESPTKIIHRMIIQVIPKLVPSTRTSSEVMTGSPVEEISNNGPSTEIIVANGNNGDAIYPHEVADEGSSRGLNPWNFSARILCNLASTEKYAGFMVENEVLEMILANLKVSKSARIKEICLRMLGNLACQEDLMESIATAVGLIEAVVQQLFLDDVQCLCEAFRLLILGLQGSKSISWVKALFPARIVERLVWITKNTSNEMLLEGGVGLFSTILQSQRQIPAVLIPYLIGQGLPELLVSLLEDEMRKLRGDSIPERKRPLLDVILQAIEALSVMEDYSHRISFNDELIGLICDLVKYPYRMEVNEARMTAAIVIANALEDDPDLAIDMSRDLQLLRGLLDTFPHMPKEKEAMWKVLSHLLVHIKEHEMGASTLLQYVYVLVDKFVLIEDILLNPPPSKHRSASSSQSSSAPVTVLSRIVSILKEWSGSVGDGKWSDAEEEYNATDSAIRRSVECCERHLKEMIG